MCVLMEAHNCVSQPYVLWYGMLSEDLLLGTRLWSMSNEAKDEQGITAHEDRMW